MNKPLNRYTVHLSYLHCAELTPRGEIPNPRSPRSEKKKPALLWRCRAEKQLWLSRFHAFAFKVSGVGLFFFFFISPASTFAVPNSPHNLFPQRIWRKNPRRTHPPRLIPNHRRKSISCHEMGSSDYDPERWRFRRREIVRDRETV